MKKILLLLFLFVCTGGAAQTHDAQWYLVKGNEYYEAENYDTAIAYYKKANELVGGNNAPCQSNIGNCYNEKKEYTQAVYWYRKAAEQGYALAQHNLGVQYATGRGVAEDQAKAVYWFRKAAEQGDALAQHNLGVCYATGNGVAEDQAKAVYWYRKAAGQGDGNSMIRLGLAYYGGSGVPEDESLGKYWMKKGLDSNPTIETLISLAKAFSKDEETQE